MIDQSLKFRMRFEIQQKLLNTKNLTLQICIKITKSIKFAVGVKSLHIGEETTVKNFCTMRIVKLKENKKQTSKKERSFKEKLCWCFKNLHPNDCHINQQTV